MIQDYGALLAAASLIPLSIKLFSLLIPRARAWGLVDRPGGRHIHAMPVAVVGGIGVVAAWLLGVALLWGISPAWIRALGTDFAWLAGCLLAVLGIGLADDRQGITPRARLAAELAVSAVTVAFVPSVQAFCHELSAYLGSAVYPLTVVGITGVMNAMNLVDGMDGLAGGMFLAISASICVLAPPLGPERAVGGVTALLLIPGLLAFLRKNWSPAVTFMGDHGSLAVGYLLVTAALSIRVRGAAHGPADLALLAAIFSYPVLDMVICMARRLRARQPVATGDRNHMHHRMLRLGLSARESVGALVGWQVAMLLPVFLIPVLPLGWIPVALLASVAVAVERLMLIGRVENARLRQYQTRVYGLLKPRGVPPLDSPFVRARVCIPLRPMVEASQFEERGCLEQMVEALRFFCERKVKGHGFVQLTADEVVVAIVGNDVGAPTPDELRRDWSEALKGFSQTFRLTYSTWSLPVHLRAPEDAAAAQADDSIEVA